MLRHFVGDEAFFASLNKYLTDNQFKNGSAIKLKLAFEAVTGKDLNWFFNQWYFGSGHPYVRITQNYDAATKQVMVKIQQTQVQDKLFTLPIGIDVYAQGKRNHYDVWSKNKVDSFYFDAAIAPDNVNVDNDKVLLWSKDESKTMEQYAFQFNHARNFLDRFEAVNEARENQNNVLAQKILQAALQDSFYVIRSAAMNSFNPKTLDSATELAIYTIAAKDKSNSNREEAIDIIGSLAKEKYKNQFIQWTKDSSYSVSGAALEALEKLDSTMAKEIAQKESKNITKKRLNTAVTNIITKYGDENVFDFVATKYEALNIHSSEKFYMTNSFAQLLIKTSDPIKFKKGIDLIVAFREAIPQGYKTQSDPYFNGKILGMILKGKKDRGEQALVDMVTEVLPKL
jgi:aminopeptidase N